MNRAFIDTNVLIYANDRRDLRKYEAARILVSKALRTRQAALSTQVLQEFAVNMLRLQADRAAIRRQIILFSTLRVVRVDVPLILIALDHAERHQINYWDASILAAAGQADCNILYTEDLNHGQTYGNVQAHNPFIGDDSQTTAL